MTIDLHTGIAVFGYIYPRDMREKLNHLSTIWKNIKAKNTIEQEEREAVVQSGTCILQLIQRTRKQFHHILQKAIDGIKVGLTISMERQRIRKKSSFLLRVY